MGEKPLKEVCNAPKDSSGVYYVIALANGRIELVYIGRSGSILNDGNVQHRKGGLFDRLVNGKQFDESRHISWAKKLKEENIEALDIYWFETCTENFKDSPSFVETLLLQRFLELHDRLPRWNKSF